MWQIERCDKLKKMSQMWEIDWWNRFRAKIPHLLHFTHINTFSLVLRKPPTLNPVILNCPVRLRAAGGPRSRKCPVHLRAAGGPRSHCQKRWFRQGFSCFLDFARNDKVLHVGGPGSISPSYVICHYKYECMIHCLQSAKGCFPMISKEFWTL